MRTSPPVGLLRNWLTKTSPQQPATNLVLPLTPADLWMPNFVPGSADQDTTVLGDPGRPLVFYAYDPPTLIKAVKSGLNVVLY